MSKKLYFRLSAFIKTISKYKFVLYFLENGFQIEFKFLSNPYFHNKKIVKKYLIDIYPDKLNENWNDENKSKSLKII